MNVMTAGEAARILKTISIARDIRSSDTEYYSKQAAALDFAASILRRVESGELREVVHANWKIDEDGHKCSKCNEYLTDEQYEYGDKRFCPSCGALMDGKDDRRAEK